MAKLHLELMTPWAPQTRFLDDCLIMERILKPEQEETKSGRLRPTKPHERLNLQLFSSLTHNSVPVTEIADASATFNQADRSMRDEARGSADMQPQSSQNWEKYVREMSPIYFNVLNVYRALIDAGAAHGA